MVKGVNKTVIEVNDTGSKMFDKIVFYVNPKYGTLTARQLSRAAKEFSFSFNEGSCNHSPSLRSIVKKKRYTKWVLAGLCGLSAVTVVLCLIF